ncbi:YadA-like family protein, partial [Pseudomonas sp. CAN2814]|uniref:YadA-like family protein n=1 Tax=Pseudomonas sp. CAN1 TaxID=3046726 RepID=UPI002648C45B
NINEKGTKYFHANSTGADSEATGVDSVAIGMGAVASHDGSIALGANSVADGSTLSKEAYLVGGTAKGEVNIGDRRITGLSAGAEDTDAVNVAQLKRVATESVANAVQYDGDDHQTITLSGGNTYNSVTKQGGTRIKNVAAGVDGGDAVNVDQLNDTVDGAKTRYYSVNDKGTIGGNYNNDGATGVNSLAAGVGAFASGANGLAMGSRAAATGASGIALGNDSSASGRYSMAIGGGSEASFANSVAIGYASKTTRANSVSVGNRQITDVRSGIEDNDAVNLAQVKGLLADLGGGLNEAIQQTQSLFSSAQGSSLSPTQNVASADAQAPSQQPLMSGNGQLQSVAPGMAFFHTNSDLDDIADAQATGTNSIAIGGNTRSAGVDSVAIGVETVAGGMSDVALGTGAVTGPTDQGFEGSGGVALGANSTALGGSTAIGYMASTSKENQVAIGTGAKVSGGGGAGTAIGVAAAVTGNSGVAIGNLATASGSQSLALGTLTSATSTTSVALGYMANGSKVNSVALGAYSVTKFGPQVNYTAAMLSAPQTSVGEIGVGTANGQRTISGVAAGADDHDAVNVLQLKAVTAGSVADAVMYDSASHDKITLGGGESGATLTNLAAGELSADSTDAVNGSQLFATNEIVNNLSGDITNIAGDVTTIGDTVTNMYETGTQYFHANSTGADSQATGVDSVAIGMGAVASHDGSIALGANSVADGSTLGNEAYLVGGTAKGEVNIGDRRITGLSAGAEDSDAVNVAQLKMVTAGSVADAVMYDSGSHDKITLGGGDSGATITNLAAGELSASSTDAVNGSQLYVTNEIVNNLSGDITSITGDITNLTGDVTNLGDTITNINEKGTKYFHANSTGADSKATGVDSVAIGMGAVASHDGSIALGAGSIADGSTLSNEAYLVGGTAKGEVNIGNRRITGLSAGAGDSDAVNVAQLKQVTAGSVADAVMYSDGNHDLITLGGTTYNSKSKSGGAKITNVARGEADSDAVNMSQLKETNANVVNLDNRVTNIEGSVTNVFNGGTKYFHSNSTKADSAATGADSVAVGPQALAAGASSVAMGDSASSSGDNAVALGSSTDAKGAASVAIGDGARTTDVAANSVALGAGSVAEEANTVSVGSKGNERRITNLAAGVNDTDAVNVAQLNGVESKITNVTGDVTNVDKRVTRIETGDAGMFQVNQTNAAVAPKATGVDAVAGGSGAEASGAKSVAIGTKSKASGTNSVAMGNGASSTASNSVALGANSVADRDNSVSVGSAGAERQITHVADASADTDAVNLRQLNAATSGFNDSINQAYSDLKHDLNKQDDILSAGIAGALAAATLPQPYVPGASMASVGMGNYRGQQALAIGVSRISDNGKWVTKLSGNLDSQGEAGVSVGVGYQW